MHTDKTPVLSVCICVHLWLSFFKDHTIYSAVAYYTEGDTLYYFTSGNVHNQVSLTLVEPRPQRGSAAARTISHRWTQMHTDKTPVLSVCICVHLWLIVFCQAFDEVYVPF
jgi:hypothetical protein